MNIGGGGGFEMRDDVRREISTEIVKRCTDVTNGTLEAKLEVVQFINDKYPLNADPGLVPEVKEAVNFLFSSIGDQNIEFRSSAQLVLDVAGPLVEGQSGGNTGAYIYDSLLSDLSKEKMRNIYNKQWGQNNELLK